MQRQINLEFPLTYFIGSKTNLFLQSSHLYLCFSWIFVFLIPFLTIFAESQQGHFSSFSSLSIPKSSISILFLNFKKNIIALMCLHSKCLFLKSRHSQTHSSL